MRQLEPKGVFFSELVVASSLLFYRGDSQNYMY